jgi:hypothetical protein
MGFKFASFGAATVPLSKIVIDKTLDMGDYALVGQMVMAPYRPYTWDTVPFQYHDTNSRTVAEGSRSLLGLDTEQLITTWTCDSPKPCYVRALITSNKNYVALKGARITVNGDTVYTTGTWAKGTTKTTDAVAVSPGEVLELYVTGPGVIQNYSLVETGYEAPINLDLKGRFLALEQDFGDLTATLTFGDEADVPFSDYPNRFPYAPDKVTLSRHTLDERPVIKVYKGV